MTRRLIPFAGFDPNENRIPTIADAEPEAWDARHFNCSLKRGSLTTRKQYQRVLDEFRARASLRHVNIEKRSVSNG